MIKKFVKLLVFLSLLIILPYGITIFLNEEIKTNSINRSEQDLKLEEYCLQVLAKEVSSEYDDEMLKVQAILVRTTIYKEVEENGMEAIQETEDEIEDFLWRQRLKKAWDETEGQVIMYGEGLALVPFHQVSCGKTRNGVDVLGIEDYPYLKSVECKPDIHAPNQIENILIPAKTIEIKERDQAGYVIRVLIDDEEMSGEAFRETYGLASSCFEFQQFENDARIITKGIGHGLGLSQYTANQMATEGKKASEILQFFFPGTEIKEVAEILWKVE